MLCSDCQAIFRNPPRILTLNDVLIDCPKYSLKRSLAELNLSASGRQGCHLCKIVSHTLGNERQLGPIQFALRLQYDEEDPLMVLFTDRDHEIRALKIRSTKDNPRLALTERFYERLGDNTASANSIELANIWLNACMTQHAQCHLQQTWKGWFPTRVIDVGSHIGSTPRLVSKTAAILGNSYVTLSHCWGSQIILTLTGDNISNFHHGIEAELPRTFEDAILLTHLLGLRYLWIDSLCIIQDSIEDWRKESSLMGEIYKNSIVTISATAASDSQGGCIRMRDPLALQPCKLTGKLYSSDTEGPIYVYSNMSNWLDTEYDGRTAPLNTRGWVLQERLLSTRILHFGSEQVFWDCCTHQASEKFPEGIPFWTGQQWRDERIKMMMLDPKRETRPWEDFFSPELDIRALRYADWSAIVDIYSRLKLTKADDKLVALSALAKQWKVWLQDDYLAGLWKNDLLRQLLWRLSNLNDSHRVRCAGYLAPTWSWASIDATITAITTITNCVIDYVREPEECIPAAKILATYVDAAGLDITGQIRSGFIQVKGSTKLAGLHTEDGELYRITDAVTGPDSDETRNPIQGSFVYPDIDFGNRVTVYCLHILSVENFYRGEPAAFALVLEPVQNAIHTYERLGCLKLTGHKARHWFDGCEQEIITLV